MTQLEEIQKSADQTLNSLKSGNGNIKHDVRAERLFKRNLKIAQIFDDACTHSSDYDDLQKKLSSMITDEKKKFGAAPTIENDLKKLERIQSAGSAATSQDHAEVEQIFNKYRKQVDDLIALRAMITLKASIEAVKDPTTATDQQKSALKEISKAYNQSGNQKDFAVDMTAALKTPNWNVARETVKKVGLEALKKFFEQMQQTLNENKKKPAQPKSTTTVVPDGVKITIGENSIPQEDKLKAIDQLRGFLDKRFASETENYSLMNGNTAGELQFLWNNSQPKETITHDKNINAYKRFLLTQIVAEYGHKNKTDSNNRHEWQMAAAAVFAKFQPNTVGMVDGTTFRYDKISGILEVASVSEEKATNLKAGDRIVLNNSICLGNETKIDAFKRIVREHAEGRLYLSQIGTKSISRSDSSGRYSAKAVTDEFLLIRQQKRIMGIGITVQSAKGGVAGIKIESVQPGALFVLPEGINVPTGQYIFGYVDNQNNEHTFADAKKTGGTFQAGRRVEIISFIFKSG